MQFFLGIDGGGTSTKACLIDETGAVISSGFGGPSNIYFTQEEQILKSIKDAVSTAAAFGDKTLNRVNIKAACAALSGAGRKQDILRATNLLKPFFGPVPFFVVEDTKAALYGALGGKDGIIVISGTGSNCLGKRKDLFKRSGGWGSLLGDEGSGFNIARRGLTAALRAFDGRDPGTTLTQKFMEHFELGTPENILPAVHKLSRDEIAALTVLVTQEALNCDMVAQKIIEEETNELAIMAKAVYKGLNFEDEVPIAAIGGCFSEPIIRDSFITHLRNKNLKVKPVDPLDPPHVGAAYMARDKTLSK